MSEQPKRNENIVVKSNNITENNEGIYGKYQEIKEYEQHFNGLENEIRKLASFWLLATLGAIAFLISRMYYGGADGSSSTQIDPKILISIVSFMGTLGLFILYILDQMVYQRLLNAVFLIKVKNGILPQFNPPYRDSDGAIFA